MALFLVIEGVRPGSVYEKGRAVRKNVKERLSPPCVYRMDFEGALGPAVQGFPYNGTFLAAGKGRQGEKESKEDKFHVLFGEGDVQDEIRMVGVGVLVGFPDEFPELFDDFRMFCRDILSFARVGFEII